MRIALRSFLFLAVVALLAPCTLKAQQQTKAAPHLSITFDVVTLTVTVKDKEGQPVGKLAKEAFEILDEKADQQMAFFCWADQEPLSVAILFDVTKSMRTGDIKWINTAREAVLRFINEGPQSTEYLIMAVGDSPRIMTDWTRDKEALTRVLSDLASVQAKTGTALYDASYLGIERLQKQTSLRRIMILVTDGEDNLSKSTYKQVRELLKHSDVLIYAISIQPFYSSTVSYGNDVLKELTSISGGAMFSPSNPEKIDAAFKSIVSELNNQYLIGYCPLNIDGKWHSVKVKVKPQSTEKRLEARTRQGYYATKKSVEPTVPKD
jgi:Ca-activated chloride channel family protein